MEELDFSKIFGETATSKASFTNENYISGWGYLGSTPPPYQLFDYLQGLNDKKSKYLYDRINDNKNSLLAHNADAGAHTPILNAIKAISGMSEYDTAPSKTISAIIPLLGLGGIVASKLDSNGYVKFANGFTIQWGTATATTGTNYTDNVTEGEVVFTFPTAFTSAPWAVFTGLQDTGSTILEHASVGSKTSTDVRLYLHALGAQNVQLSTFVFAIGN